MYNIEFKNSVKKDLKNINKSKVSALIDEISTLSSGIDDKSNVIKLKGNNPYYRLKTGDYRVIFEIFEDKLVIVVIKVGHRKDIYKQIK